MCRQYPEITVPIGIFCAIKLCRPCLNSHDNKIKSPYENGSGFLLGETHELETELDQSQSKVNKSEKPKEKPVKIVTKID